MARGKIANLTEIGKIPPHAIDMEEVVLGAILLQGESIYEIIDRIKPECFYKDAHQKIYGACLGLVHVNKSINILTVTEELRKKSELEEIGGPFYITQLTNRVASAANIEDHAAIIYEKYIQRELIRISCEIQDRAFDDSVEVEELINYSEKELFNITENSYKSSPKKLISIANKRVQTYYDLKDKKIELLGVPSGLTLLDRVTLGFQKKELIIFAARPGVGKTYTVVHFIINAALLHKKVALFSLEMSEEQITDRIISVQTGYEQSRLKTGNLRNSELSRIDELLFKMSDYEIYIDDTPALNIFEFRSKARRLKMKQNIDIIYIDYLQLMTTNKEKGRNREQEVSEISRTLKSIAKELDVPIIALSQLNRDADGKKPQLSNLRESGAIEQDADMVIFIHREKENGILSLDMEFIIAKFRNGWTGSLDFVLKDESFSEIIDLEKNVTTNKNTNETNDNPVDDLPF